VKVSNISLPSLFNRQTAFSVWFNSLWIFPKTLFHYDWGCSKH